MSVFSTMCVQYHLNIYVAAARTYYQTKYQNIAGGVVEVRLGCIVSQYNILKNKARA